MRAGKDHRTKSHSKELTYVTVNQEILLPGNKQQVPTITYWTALYVTVGRLLFSGHQTTGKFKVTPNVHQPSCSSHSQLVSRESWLWLSCVTVTSECHAMSRAVISRLVPNFRSQIRNPALYSDTHSPLDCDKRQRHLTSARARVLDFDPDTGPRFTIHVFTTVAELLLLLEQFLLQNSSQLYFKVFWQNTCRIHAQKHFSPFHQPQHN